MEVHYGTEDVVFLLERERAETVWRKRIGLMGIERGGAARPLTRFFFFDKFCVWQKFIKNHSPAVKTPDLRL